MLWWTLLQLRSKQTNRRKRAAEKLGNLRNTRAVDALVTALNDEDSDVRFAAAQALGYIKDPRAVESLITSLGDSSWGVQAAAAESLGWIGDTRAIGPLVTKLKDSITIRQAAGHALNSLGWQPMTVSEKAFQAVAMQDWNTAVSLGAASVEPLVNAIYEEQAARQALVKIGAPAVAPLLKTLMSQNYYLRQAANDTLSQINDPQAIPTLVAMVNSPDGLIPVQAVAMLGRIGGVSVITPLLTALKKRTGPYDHEVAQKALLAIGPPAIEPLVAMLQDNDRNFKRSIIEILLWSRDPRAIQPLLLLLENERDGDVRSDAVRALSQFDDPRIWQKLEAALNDEYSGVRWAAAEAFKRNGDYRGLPVYLEALNSDWEQRHKDAVYALGEIGDEHAVLPLVDVINDIRLTYEHLDNEETTKIERVLGALKLVLERSAASIRSEDLQAIIQINETYTYVYTSDEGHYEHVKKSWFDCHEVKALTHRELVCRGLISKHTN